MRRALVVAAVLALALAGAWWLRRDAAPRARAPASDSASADFGATHERARGVEPSASHAAAASGARAELADDEGEERETAPTRVLRVRVVDEASGATLRGCWVGLSYGGASLARARELPDGSHESGATIAAGTEVRVEPPPGWELDSDRVELDAPPDEELVFAARILPAGPVRGRIVDERDGAPIPYLRFGVGGERLVTDWRGEFRGVEPHPRGTLEFYFGSHEYELRGFDPARDEALVVPARVGPTVFLELDRAPSAAGVWWSSVPLPDDAVALPYNSSDGAHDRGVERAELDLDPIPRARFSPYAPARLEGGEVWVVCAQDFLGGRAKLPPGRGTLEHPLRVELRRCGVVVVRARPSRARADDEELYVALGGARMPYDRIETALLVFDEGEREVEVLLDEVVLATARVDVVLGQVVEVALDVLMPGRDAEVDEVVRAKRPLQPVRGVVESVLGRHYRTEVRLTSLHDGDESGLSVTWRRVDGRWLASIEDDAPAGEYRVRLQIEPAFEWRGPRELTLPHTAPLEFTIDDDVRLVDFYLAPVAAEDGRPLASFDADAIAGEDTIGGNDFVNPTVPLVLGHPRTVPFDWACWAPGRRPACGTWTPDGGEGDVVIPVVLERGEGARLYVCNELDYSPLAGVRVLADGALAGVTGSSGWLCLGARPARLAFELEGWTLADGDLGPDGELDSDDFYLHVALTHARPR